MVRLQKGVRLTQKMEDPLYGVMRAQTFDALVSGGGGANSVCVFVCVFAP